jgi:hypothetical protein
MQIFDHNIVVLEKRHFCRQKLAKIAENCDHNIDPRTKALFQEPALPKKARSHYLCN